MTKTFELIQQLAKFPPNTEIYISMEAKNIFPSEKNANGTIDFTGITTGDISVVPYDSSVKKLARMNIHI